MRAVQHRFAIETDGPTLRASRRMSWFYFLSAIFWLVLFVALALAVYKTCVGEHPHVDHSRDCESIFVNALVGIVR